MNKDFMTIIEAAAHQGGLAIQNASMYLQLQESKKPWKKESGAIAPGFNKYS